MTTSVSVVDGGGYRFERGYPTPEATRQAREDADYQRALTAYRFWYPTVSVEGFVRAAREADAAGLDTGLVVLSAGPRFICFTPKLAHVGDESAVDLYFGPSPPQSHEDRWIKTNPDQGWFTYFRIYGPEEPAFDGTWKPGDFEET